jgi:hypothetical protein
MTKKQKIIAAVAGTVVAGAAAISGVMIKNNNAPCYFPPERAIVLAGVLEKGDELSWAEYAEWIAYLDGAIQACAVNGKYDFGAVSGGSLLEKEITLVKSGR